MRLTRDGRPDQRGRKPGGVADFVRCVLRATPRATTQKIRTLAYAKFGYTYQIDRHFPQLVYQIRKELRGERKARTA